MTRPAKTAKTPPAKKAHNPQATRETVESIVIAVVLAFLFRGFVAEAFVIPTGSMAPTLMGRHVDVYNCPNCEYRYQTGASEENNEPGSEGYVQVQVTYCPICRFPKELDRKSNKNEVSFTGDRILVSKYQYELNNPARWDVIVFKYPANAKQNYIKRLVGLPNELVRIRHGDIYVGQRLFELDSVAIEQLEENATDLSAVRDQFEAAGHPLSEDATIVPIQMLDRPRAFSSQSAEGMWTVMDPENKNYREMLIRLGYDGQAEVYVAPQIVRKPPKKERALLQLVHDTKHQGKFLTRVGWPSRWNDSADNPIWSEEEPGRYISKDVTSDWGWLRYRHIYPSAREWETILRDKNLPNTLERGRGSLISDYYAYNDREPSRRRMPGHHWVGDLAIEAELQLSSERGELAFDLVEAGVHYRCTIDVATGKATLSISEESVFLAEDGTALSEPPTADTSVRGPGKYTVRFVNVDDQLRLWVDGAVVTFNQPTTYRPPQNSSPRSSDEDPGDLAPAGVGVRGAVVQLHRLKVLRDIYYVAVAQSPGNDEGEYSNFFSLADIERIFRQPDVWSSTKLFESRPTVEFVIGDKQYFPLGDNSPQSADARMFPNGEPYFAESMLIGKAMLIYWPHGWNAPIPFFPNFSRMSLIH